MCCRYLTETATSLLRGGQWIIIDGRWDLIIAHPPCTYLTGVGNRHFSLRVTDAEKVVKRWQDRCEAIIFFMQCALADCDRIAVENPIGFMGHWRKPDQVINPYQFAESVDDSENYQMKTTCLWLKNLPKLRTNKLPKPLPVKEYVNISGKIKRRYFEENHGVIDGEKHGGNDSKARSRTFSGVARAMAEAWG